MVRRTQAVAELTRKTVVRLLSMKPHQVDVRLPAKFAPLNLVEEQRSVWRSPAMYFRARGSRT